MSTVFVQVGQCGNQIGSSFWGKAARINHAPNPFLDEFGKARCILVDAEPKVIASAIAQSPPMLSQAASFQRSTSSSIGNRDLPAGVSEATASENQIYGVYRKSNVVYEQSGRGNNWALGYFGKNYSEGQDGSLCDQTLNCLEKEAERCDVFSGVFLMHSTTGGTGSGLGSRVLECICDRYPTQFRLTNTTLPALVGGDSSLQSYNTLLTLARLQQCADGITFQDNDTMWAAAAGLPLPRLSRPESVVKPPTLDSGNSNRSATLNSGNAAWRSLMKQSESKLASSSSSSASVSLRLNALAAPSNQVPNPVKLEQLNDDVASGLLDVLAPWTHSSYQQKSAIAGKSPPHLVRPFQSFDFVQSVCPMPSLKFVEIYNANVSSSKSKSKSITDDGETIVDLCKSLASRIPMSDFHAQPCRTLFQLVIARGGCQYSPSTSSAASSTLANLLHPDQLLMPTFSLQTSFYSMPYPNPLCASQQRSGENIVQNWFQRLRQSFPLESTELCPEAHLIQAPHFDLVQPLGAKSKTNLPSKQQPSSLATCLNRTRIVSMLQHILSRAQNMFYARAFLHWYTRYGCEEADFHEAFEVIQTIIDEYQAFMS